jgi:hypothetical protein
MADPCCATARLGMILRRPLSTDGVWFRSQALGMVPFPCGWVKTRITDPHFRLLLFLQ